MAAPLSCSGSHAAAASRVLFGQLNSFSAVQVSATSNVSFGHKLESSFASHFGLDVVKQVKGVVNSANADKPRLFQEWSESLVISVLHCLAGFSSNFPIGLDQQHSLKKQPVNHNLEVSSSERPSVPIAAAGCKSIFDAVNNKVISNESKDACTVIANASSSKVEVPDSSVGAFGSVFVSDSGVGAVFGNINDVPFVDVDVQPVDVPKAISPCTDECAMPIPMPTSIPSASPVKHCKPVYPLSFVEKPSMDRFKASNESRVPLNAAIASVNDFSGLLDFKFKSELNNFSPIVPVRLSQAFLDEVDKVKCSQSVSAGFNFPHGSPGDQDCVEVVTIPESKVSKSFHLLKANQVDLSSPVALTPSLKKQELAVDAQEVQFAGTSYFSDRSVKLCKETSDAYNQLNNISTPHSSKNFRKLEKGVVCSLEVMIVDDPRATKTSNEDQKACALGYSSQNQHIPRRIVAAARHTSDPFVHQMNRFPVTLQQRRHYVAINQIGSHNEWCKYEAVRFDRAYCSYRSLSSLRPDGHIDNFLILCFCRYLFNQSRPSSSKKHFFFTYVGETILTNSNPEFVRNAFNGANSAFLMWRSNFLYFPIGLEGHWFSFVVCIKDHAFVFLDSFYGENSPFHMEIRDVLITNFITLWDAFITPMMNKRIVFEDFDVLYPSVPKQENGHDCGVFTSQYMQIFSPRTQMSNRFSTADIPNLRVKYANDLFFSEFNSCDKSFVTQYFKRTKG